MDLSLWLIGGVGFSGLLIIFYLWRQFSNLRHKAAQADIMRLRYEEETRKNAELKRQAKLHNVPMPADFDSIINEL